MRERVAPHEQYRREGTTVEQPGPASEDGSEQEPTVQPDAPLETPGPNPDGEKEPDPDRPPSAPEPDSPEELIQEAFE
jgi:hypothetical protein